MARIRRWQVFFSEAYMETENTTEDKQNKTKLWLKRVGIAGFLFFLIKGLIWIGVAVWAGKALFD